MRKKRIRDPQLAFDYCREIACDIKESTLKKVALQVLEENREVLVSAKGSDWEHHNYAGGLIVHICNVTQNAIQLAEFYDGMVNMDLLKFCALMHDIGKTFDYKNNSEFPNKNTPVMNQALLGHSFEGACYIAGKLETEYFKGTVHVTKEYAKKVITQVSHCIGAHMDGFGACAKQKMFEVVIIGCADKIDAYLEQTILEDREDSFVIGTGEVFYKSFALWRERTSS